MPRVDSTQLVILKNLLEGGIVIIMCVWARDCRSYSGVYRMERRVEIPSYYNLISYGDDLQELLECMPHALANSAVLADIHGGAAHMLINALYINGVLAFGV